MPAPATPCRSFTKYCRDFPARFRFKFILPWFRTAVIDGIKLDISTLSSVMKNNLLHGRYELQERHLAAQALGQDDVVLELGGAIGFIGLFCRKLLVVRHVTSVEANPATLKLLQRNYAFNHLVPNFIHAAAAAEDGEMDLCVEGEFWENTLTETTGHTVRVPTRSLGSLVAAMPHSPTALICDIEGAEQYLDFSQLPLSVTKIIMEVHPTMIGQATVDLTLERLRALGFRERTWLQDVVWLERNMELR